MDGGQWSAVRCRWSSACRARASMNWENGVDQWRHGSLPPVFEGKVLKRVVVGEIEGNENEVVGPCDGGDLTDGEWRGSAQAHQARPLRGVPFGSTGIIAEGGDRGRNNLVQVSLDRCAPDGLRKTVTAQQQLMPHDRGDGDLCLVPFQAAENLLMRSWTQWLGDDVGVQQILQGHRVTSRPSECSRVPANTSGSISSSSRSTNFRNSWYDSQKRPLPVCRRSYSRTASSTATGSPRRGGWRQGGVSSSWPSAGNRARPSAMEYLLVIVTSRW